ncbi:MAG: hypothetical protein JO235_02430 [Chroococcidiopsidaceae cyanobacterium CP_BM_RX_35]|nr:hypothetical protein [Chroococcidiopsidaceae cyanobacterium CP_BM_RX_35]
MSRLIQAIRNTFIRLEGWLYQIFGFLGQVFSWLLQRFNFLGKLLGFAESQYLQEDETQRLQSAKAEREVTAPEPQAAPPVASSTRRRPDASMDYFRKLAQQTKTSK